ncbi:cation channel sperm-associated protein subunit epsilon isoform X2 [Crotalus tigris]|uniref:cation channel sperm-associated protein subunit epsilon isoform X2 n=1 Tax=Crotalus tigris TaxID=88082 RepID=UPI00192F8C42|nr:cation channel sperm-associated protein subunit epsilon isoform X2 [Crotalus tigris]
MFLAQLRWPAFLILPLLLDCLWWNGCGAVWRYRTSIGTYMIFSTRTTIYLEYEGTTFSRWDVPSFCTVGDATKKATTLFCSVPGTHRIQPVTVPASDDEERYLSINADVNCFSWYIYQDENRLRDTGPTQIIKLWLYDPENADKKEKLNIATSPPILMSDMEWASEDERNKRQWTPILHLESAAAEKTETLGWHRTRNWPWLQDLGHWSLQWMGRLLYWYSRSLSWQFWNLGQEPRIRTLFRRTEYFSKSFYNGVWMIEVPSQANDNMAIVLDKTVTFQDCFVHDIPFTIAQPMYILGTKTGVSVTLPAGSDAIIEWSACYPKTAAIVTVDGIFYTSNGFLKVTEIKFPPDLVPSGMIHQVKDIAILFPNAFILIGNVLYQASVDEIINMGEFYFPHVRIIGTQSKTWCADDYPLTERKLSEIIIWSEDEVFLGYPENEFHPLIAVGLLREKLKLQRTVNLLIVSACYDSLSATIAILLECTGCTSKKILYLAAYKEDTAEWILRDFTLGLPTVGAIHMEVTLSVLTSMVLWDDDTVFYTYKNHRHYGYLHESGTKNKFSAVSEGSAIHQIIIDYSGNAIIKLKNNALFFFKFEVTDVIKLTAWESNDKKFIFFFNPSADIYLMTINGTNISRQVYPLKLEVLSAASKLNDVCPYISFEQNLNLGIRYVDMGDKVTFWGQIVFLENNGLSVDVEIYRPELLKTKDLINYEIARGICTKNKTVTFYHERDYSELSDYRTQIALSQGIMSFEFQPSESGKTCLSKSQLSHIRVGCPPWKKIIVSKKPTKCENYTFTIPRKYLRDKGDKGNMEVIFDIEKYGCPLQSHYTQDFYPQVEMYKDHQTLIPVEANYILWEMNGRTDFYYRATMEKVRCLNTAQSWNQMIKIYNKTIKTIEDVDEIWGPHTRLDVCCWLGHLGSDFILGIPHLQLLQICEDISGIPFC